jgi:hypothetical protein
MEDSVWVEKDLAVSHAMLVWCCSRRMAILPHTSTTSFSRKRLFGPSDVQKPTLKGGVQGVVSVGCRTRRTLGGLHSSTLPSPTFSTTAFGA